MNTREQNLWETLNYYLPLLKRYARRLTQDETAATKLAKQVLEAQFALDKLTPTGKLRQVLKTDLHNRCLYRKQFAILDRPPVKVPSRRPLPATKLKNQIPN